MSVKTASGGDRPPAPTREGEEPADVPNTTAQLMNLSSRPEILW